MGHCGRRPWALSSSPSARGGVEDLGVDDEHPPKTSLFSPVGGFAQEVGLGSTYFTYNDLKILLFLSILDFWTKPLSGEGEVIGTPAGSYAGPLDGCLAHP